MPSRRSETRRSRRRTAGLIDPKRRTLLVGAATLAALSPFTGVSVTPARAERAGAPLRFGLTPVFLSNDLALLAALQRYLERATGRPVRLITRRTYQEITALLVAAELDAAWICGFPFVAFRSQLTLLAAPVWRGETLYQSYLIAKSDRPARGLDDLAGDIHAYSDPDSNSGYLVTRALLAERAINPDAFFRRALFTYGHRNVVRAVASGLAASGSVDGYVVEVLREVEPELTDAIHIVRASEWLGFPPICAAASQAGSERVEALRRAVLSMHGDPVGREALSTLRLDGFAERDPALYDPIADKVALVRPLE